MSNMDSDGKSAVRLRPTARKTQNVVEWLLCLDVVVNPGITQAQFRRLFMRCADCGDVMTRRVFAEHDCTREETIGSDTGLCAVINLVSDEEI